MNRQWGAAVLVALAVAGITILLHWPATRNGFTRWDDDLYLAEVEKHPTLSAATLRWAFTAPQPFYYQPLTWVSVVADRQLFGPAAAGTHGVSVVLHGVNAALVVALAWMLTGNGIAAGLAGLVFGIHPMQVESVAWYCERKNVLCALFALASLCAYVRYAHGTGSRRWWWMTLGLAVAALLSKPMAVSLPAVMLAMDYFPMRRHESLGWRRVLVEKAPLILICAGFSILTVIAQATGGAMMELERLGFGDRLLVAVRGTVFYLWKLIWPIWLSPYYPLGGRISLGTAEFLVPAIVVLAVTISFWWWRGKWPALLAGWSAYLAWLLPVSGLFQAGAQAAADRFMYVAMVPVLLLMAGGGVLLWRRMSVVGRTALGVLLAGQLVFLAARSREQIHVWRNEETLWQDVVSRFPMSVVANFHLAVEFVQQHRFDEAIGLAERVVEGFPENPMGYSALGVSLLKTRQYEKAVPVLERAVQLDSTLWASRYNLACAYSRVGNLERAYRMLKDLIAAQPEFARMAARDGELAALRNHPDYQPRFFSLTGLVREDGR